MKKTPLLKILTLCLFFLLIHSPFAFSAKQKKEKPSPTLIIDDFEDGEIKQKPQWWSFGNLEVGAFQNDLNELKGLESYSLRIQGTPNKKWYLGGLGTYLGLDCTPYNAIKLVIYGQGPSSGTLIIELFDDDNRNWIIEKHPEYESQTKFDDVFRYTLKVNWIGWRVVMIPLSHFRDSNPGIGDDSWNPNLENGSGGLIQMQLIVLTGSKQVKPDLRIDTIKLFKETPEKIKAKAKPVTETTEEWW